MSDMTPEQGFLQLDLDSLQRWSLYRFLGLSLMPEEFLLLSSLNSLGSVCACCLYFYAPLAPSSQ